LRSGALRGCEATEFLLRNSVFYCHWQWSWLACAHKPRNRQFSAFGIVLGAQIGQDPWRPTHPIGGSINGHNGGNGGAAGNGANAGILVGNGGTGGAGGFGVVTPGKPGTGGTGSLFLLGAPGNNETT
jgi:hypothetical protein